MHALLIHDGYTLDGCVPARGPWPALKFRYRPACAEQVYEFGLAPKDSGKARLKATVDFLAGHVLGWDITGDDGDPLPVSPENLRRLPGPVLDGLLDHVAGYAGTKAEGDQKN